MKSVFALGRELKVAPSALKRERHGFVEPGCVIWMIGSFVVTVMLAVSGCKQGDAGDSSASTLNAAEAPRKESRPEYGPKLNGYVVDCVNKFSANVFRSEDHYYGWASPGTPPSEKTPNIRGILSIFIEAKPCLEAIARSNAMPPQDTELEAAATRYGEAISELRPVLDEARGYYEKQEYKSDHFVKAQILHASLGQRFDKFREANRVLGARIEAIHDEEDAQDLIEIEKTDGRKLLFLVRAAFLRVKFAARAAREAAATKDIAAFDKSYQDMDAIVGELLAYRNAHAGEVHEARAGGYVQDVETFVRYAQELRPHLAKSAPASTERLDRQYNAVVAKLNALRL